MAGKGAHLGGALLVIALAGSVQASDPLSAIEWLEKRPKQVVVPLVQAPRVIDEPPAAIAITTPEVTVTPLGAPMRAAAGLLPSSVTGLPRDLWSDSEAGGLGALLGALDVERLPALQSLLYTLLLAEADPPYDTQSSDFLRARVKKLLDLGAVDPASALLDRADPAHLDLFDYYFDAALLNGDAEAPCKALSRNPALSRDLARRIFCDVRSENWDNAALALSTADAIGALEPMDVALLEHFLDPELFEDSQVPPAPARPSVLQFRLYEAIGEALPTAALPRAFAATDLSGDAGWKAQLDAAERLARIGAISENRLLGIYTSRIPSASGGIWDRVEAVQRLETALASGDPAAALKQSAQAWDKMKEVGLEVPFATLFSEALLRFPASGADDDLVTRIALLSPLYEQAAQRETDDPLLKIAQGVAVGAPETQSEQALAIAILRAFSGETVPQFLSEMATKGRLGEAILRAMSLTATGAAGDPSAAQSGLAFLRSVGLEDTARRTALQMLLLDFGDQR